MQTPDTTPAQTTESRTDQNVGHAEDGTENRFGELGKRDTFEENRDLGHLGPIYREVRDKVKETTEKVKAKLES
ncbi:hypothetical protein EXIGLDRAFT_727888 [Exidia glandulosa HHB12029]|uniref:Uncharacterized protein n=1 Tax=Exidia glandulosa HHB12029 TaxID=1314781 RepID=A0A165JSP4_EXIGL|nr:hypothetical protein EXIGLDRAFT_735575 [Exidia glandulosa HHB12029]KZV98517.1 hypothetical protein EXIGLDRAFT_727888 [Exidia glandulosa HHB12029]